MEDTRRVDVDPQAYLSAQVKSLAEDYALAKKRNDLGVLKIVDRIGDLLYPYFFGPGGKCLARGHTFYRSYFIGLGIPHDAHELQEEVLESLLNLMHIQMQRLSRQPVEEIANETSTAIRTIDEGIK